MSKNLGLYIHIPFCRSKCPYCDFFSLRSGQNDYVSYTNTIKEKIKMWSTNADKTIDTIYFGGGTPSVIGADLICEIMNCVKENFNVINNAEITLEANPSSGLFFDFEKARRSGINRVSIGMQSANENELKKLGRLHSAEDVLNTINLIRKAGINNISLDVMLGVPEQTIESLKSTLDFCKSTGVHHISSYMLKIEEGTYYAKNRNKFRFPDDEAVADMYLFACDYLDKLGYKQYEISNYSVPGFESRHNTKYWTLDEYLGIGPSAHSFMNGKRFYYGRSIVDFKDDKIIDDGDGGTFEERIMLGLRLAEGIDIKKCHEEFGLDISEKIMAKTNLYINSGQMKKIGNKLSFTPQGFLVSNSILAELI